MPTYDYYCTKCDLEFEVFHGINQVVEHVCDRCAGKTEKKIGAGAGVIYKGSGFYTTDYNRSDAYKKASKENSN